MHWASHIMLVSLLLPRSLTFCSWCTCAALLLAACSRRYTRPRSTLACSTRAADAARSASNASARAGGKLSHCLARKR